MSAPTPTLITIGNGGGRSVGQKYSTLGHVRDSSRDSKVKLKGPLIMNDQVTPSTKIPYTVVEVDSNGDVVTPKSGDTCTVVSADTAACIVAPDISQFAGGFIKGGTKLENGVVITATITHSDGSAAFVTTKPVDNVAGPAVGDAITFGSPVSQ